MRWHVRCFSVVSLALKIQCSCSTFYLLEEIGGYTLTCRGVLQVKVREHFITAGSECSPWSFKHSGVYSRVWFHRVKVTWWHTGWKGNTLQLPVKIQRNQWSSRTLRSQWCTRTLRQKTTPVFLESWARLTALTSCVTLTNHCLNSKCVFRFLLFDSDIKY